MSVEHSFSNAPKSSFSSSCLTRNESVPFKKSSSKSKSPVLVESFFARAWLCLSFSFHACLIKFLPVTRAKQFVTKANGKAVLSALSVAPGSSLKVRRTFGSLTNHTNYAMTQSSKCKSQCLHLMRGCSLQDIHDDVRQLHLKHEASAYHT